MRRGLPIETYPFADFQELINMFAEEMIYIRELKIRSSHAYRIGSFVLKPFKFLKKIFKY